MSFNYSKSKKVGIIFIIAGTVSALITATAIYLTISRFTSKVSIYVAASNIIKGDPLKTNMLKIVKIAKDGLPEDALTPDTNLSTYITNKDMSPGDILRKTNTTDLKHDNPSLLSARLRALEGVGMVAGEIPVDSVEGMLNDMKSGDKVYIVCAYKEKIAQGAKDSVEEVVKSKEVLKEAIIVGLKKQQDGKAALIIAMQKADALNLAISREQGKLYVYLLPLGNEETKVIGDTNSSLSEEEKNAELTGG